MASINFVKYRKIYYCFTGLVMVVCLGVIIVFGFLPGMEFTGGSLLEIEYKDNLPSNPEIRQQLANLNLGEITIQPAGQKEVILRMKDVDENTHQQILQKLGEKNKIEEKRFESIGPVIGRELKTKTFYLIFLSLFAIVFYIAIAFIKVKRPIKSWLYSLIALIILSHDILIPSGVMAFLGKFYGVQITIPVIVALLTVLGYAINNVVVVFDRIRENILIHHFSLDAFEEIINKSINQTLTRQLNTSLTTLFPLLAIFFIGGQTLRYFSLTLIFGIIAGTYSSIFLAGPLFITWLSRKVQVNI